MIITLKGADFSTSNIGTLSTWNITRVLGDGATYDGVTYVDRDAAFNATVTIAEGYELGAAGVTVTMGGEALDSGITVNENIITIAIDSVTGNVKITVPTINISTGEEDSGNEEGGSTVTLVQGYVSGATVDNELQTRVRIDGLVSGAFYVECNDGYVIRAIQECASTTPSASDANIVVAADLKTSYSGGSAGKYYAITFCKTDASASISPTENIVKSFSGTIVAITSDSATDDTVADTDVNYTLQQGAWIANGSLYNSTNRVCTTEKIKGKFTVTVNDGFAIRAVYQYDTTSSEGTMVSETSETLTTYTSTNDSKYYGVTFTYASPNAANNISPTEDIIAEWIYV